MDLTCPRRTEHGRLLLSADVMYSSRVHCMVPGVGVLPGLGMSLSDTHELTALNSDSLTVSLAVTVP